MPQAANADNPLVIECRHRRKSTADGLHDELYWRMPGGKAAYRWGDWKVVRPNRDAPFELYRLTVDPSETNDLATRHPDRLRRLVDRWYAVDNQMAEPIEPPR